ncbi:hypothetical protein FB451DRAFT_1398600 [Mycena latifolia]|nr:hypothetical protein FB451DRAFT_1398600 [Mycena latifolia]
MPFHRIEEIYASFMLEDMVPPFSCDICHERDRTCHFISWGKPCLACKERLCGLCSFMSQFKWNVFRNGPYFNPDLAPFGRKILDYTTLDQHVPAVFEIYSRSFTENNTGLYELQLSLMNDLPELLELERKWTAEDYSSRALLLISHRILHVTTTNKRIIRYAPY